MTPYWHREDKVGIDTKGRFFTNSLKDGNTAFSISHVPAFGASVNDKQYAGGQFELFNKRLFKIFAATNEYSSTSTVYLSGSSNDGNEYDRPISIHGSQLSVYTKESNASTSTTTKNRLIVSHSKYELGNDDNLLQINNSTTANQDTVILKTTGSSLIDIYNEKGHLKIGEGIVFTTLGSKSETIGINS